MAISRRLGFMLGIATIVLIIPLIAMQFTTEVNWDISDFIIAGLLLYGTGIIIDFILAKSKKHTTVLIVAILVLIE